MLYEKIKILCAIVFALTVSGCGSGGGEDGDIADPVALPLENTVNTEDTTTSELTVSMDTSESTATPVQPVSTVQMDAFVENPLVTVIPSELASVMATQSSTRFVKNPLIQ